METPVHEEQIFDGIDYSEKKLPKAEYIDCTFINCNFSKGILNNSDFMDCDFKGCNFSMAVLENTGLKDARFKDCKMIGVDFSKCSDFMFSVQFTNSPLDYCSFFRGKMKKTVFTDCAIKNADFTETDLSMAIFDKCDLTNTVFVQSNLEKTDFRTAKNYAIDPEQNKMKKAKFSSEGIAGLLAKYNIDID